MDILTQTASCWKAYTNLTGTSKNLGGLNVSKNVYSAWRASSSDHFYMSSHTVHRNFDFDFHVYWIVTLTDHRSSPTTPELKRWLLWTQFRSLVEPTVVVERLMSLATTDTPFNIGEILILECSCIVPLTETPDRLRRLQNSNPDFFELSLGAL